METYCSVVTLVVYQKWVLMTLHGVSSTLVADMTVVVYSFKTKIEVPLVTKILYLCLI